jgi:DnaJ domain
MAGLLPSRDEVLAFDTRQLVGWAMSVCPVSEYTDEELKQVGDELMDVVVERYYPSRKTSLLEPWHWSSAQFSELLVKPTDRFISFLLSPWPDALMALVSAKRLKTHTFGSFKNFEFECFKHPKILLSHGLCRMWQLYGAYLKSDNPNRSIKQIEAFFEKLPLVFRFRHLMVFMFWLFQDGELEESDLLKQEAKIRGGKYERKYLKEGDNLTDLFYSAEKVHLAILEFQPHEEPTLQEVERRFRKLMLKYHPDRNPSPEAAEKAREITVAYDALKRIYSTKLT